MSSTMDRLRKRAVAAQTGAEREVLIPLDKLKFDPTQPRKAYHALDGRVSAEASAYIEELAASIKENGLIEPITVQEQGDGTYLVVVGECRTRAHLHLGMPTIRATVRNDLINPARRLIYQIAENVNRQDLTDEELALSIKLLLENGNDGKPMRQAEVAAHLGKSEGWVTRFVKFGDEELQRVWVKSGIVDSVEKLYRLSLLPKPVQMDILRRVELPEGDPEHYEKPLNRNLIDDLTREVKNAKSREAFRSGAVPPLPVESATSGTGQATGQPTASGSEPGGHVVGDNVIDLAVQEILQKQHAESTGAASSVAGTESTSAGKYALSEEARQKLLSDATIDTQQGASLTAEDLRQAPVHCRVSVKNMEALLKLLEEDQGTLDSARSIRCDLVIPGGLAGQIANKLAGVIVDEQEVPAVVQSQLVMLG